MLNGRSFSIFFLFNRGQTLFPLFIDNSLEIKKPFSHLKRVFIVKVVQNQRNMALMAPHVR